MTCLTTPRTVQDKFSKINYLNRSYKSNGIKCKYELTGNHWKPFSRESQNKWNIHTVKDYSKVREFL